ncbi:MAG: NUDIX hydrolase [Planctomycetota bacterium]|nr:NUDIX hydrolase [Planctomycetota bacterium]
MAICMDQSDPAPALPESDSELLGHPGRGTRLDPRFELVEESLSYQGARYVMFTRRERLPDGRVVDRDVLRHPGAAAILPLLGDDRLILIEQYRPALGHNVLEIPAGLIEPGEEPIECARREVREETGFEAGKVTPLLEILPATGFSDERMYIFVAEDLNFVGQDPDEDEWVKVHSVSYLTAKKLLESGEIIDGKTVAALLHWFGLSS